MSIPDGTVPPMSVKIIEEWLEMEGNVYKRSKFEGEEWSDWEVTPHNRIPFYVIRKLPASHYETPREGQ